MPRVDRSITIFVAVIVGVMSFLYVRNHHHTPVPPHTPVTTVNETWIIGQNSIQLMLHDGASRQLIEQAFNNNHTFVYGDTSFNRNVPSEIGVPTISYSSYAAIAQAFADGTLPGKYKAVIYDNERWAATPVVEQQSPAHYEQLVGQLLHSHGLIYIAAPAPDLMWATGKPTNSYDAFLNANMAATAAQNADVLDLQAQVKETNVSAFTAFVQAATDQARLANPHIKVVVGIRTNPGGMPMYTAYQATASVSDGYWLNVNGHPSPAVYLLRQLFRMN